MLFKIAIKLKLWTLYGHWIFIDKTTSFDINRSHKNIFKVNNKLRSFKFSIMVSMITDKITYNLLFIVNLCL